MRNVRFLVVDDSATARSLVSSIIRKRLGAERILHADSGMQALRLLQEQPVDMVLSDWNMDQVNGAELLEYVRRHERLKQLPFIMVTTNNRREYIADAFRLGVSHYLVKPFTPAELEQRIRSAWRNRRGNDRQVGLPPHRVLFKTADRLCAGELIDLSRTGALMRVHDPDAPPLQHRCELSISFNDAESGRPWPLPTIAGTTVRLQPQADGRSLVALQFDTETLPTEVTASLEALIADLAARPAQPGCN